jgi:hypothetical protein
MLLPKAYLDATAFTPTLRIAEVRKTAAFPSQVAAIATSINPNRKSLPISTRWSNGSFAESCAAENIFWYS